MISSFLKQDVFYTFQLFTAKILFYIYSFLTLDYDASNGLTLNYISLIFSHNPCCISLCFSLERSLSFPFNELLPSNEIYISSNFPVVTKIMTSRRVTFRENAIKN